MKPKLYQQQHIEYTKDNGEVTERVIIPMINPQPNVKAIDVTDFSVQERNDVEQKINEYQQYIAQHQSTMFSFETWCEHQNSNPIPLKWRTFKPSNTKLV